MDYIYGEWKKLLDSFQQCVEKDLEEIHKDCGGHDDREDRGDH